MSRTAPIVLLLAVAAHSQALAPGLRLHGRSGSTNVQLLDNTGAVVHAWTGALPSLGAVRVLPDGSLLRDVVVNTTIPLPGITGGVQRVAFDGTVLWDYRHSGAAYSSHHDLKPLPNGNVLLIVWERKSAAQAFAAGRDPALLTGASFYPDAIVEVQPVSPTTGVVVWEWHSWDHLVQDFDPQAANYGDVAAHPELLDINYPPVVLANGDWTHANGIDYEPSHDWIVLSCRERSEILVIDHSTTTAQAAGHTGGRWGKGGDLLYRWGNPAAYRAGAAADQRSFFQHCPRFIPPGVPGAGNLTLFNNDFGPGASAVFELQLPLDAQGNFVLGPGGRYGPDAPVWSFSAPGFFSPFISSAERLPNGNTLVCSGVQGVLFEVTPDGQVPWAVQPGGTGIFQASYVDRTLWASNDTVSVARGGTVALELRTGSSHAGEMYLVLGSLSGTTPGIPLGAVTLPLNQDALLRFTLGNPNLLPLQQTLGLLGATGDASAAFLAPPRFLPLELVGQDLAFAALLVDLDTFNVTWATNPVRVTVHP